MKKLGFVMGGFLAAGLAWAQPAGTPAPAAGPGGVQPPEGKGAIRTADDLLTRLETADAALRSLDADILYNRVFGLEGDEQERRGKLYYVDSMERTPEGAPAPGARKFSINFKTVKLGKQPPMPQDQVLIFDGEWLVEKLPGEKQIIKRQITRAGQGFDPLKVGEGPFPLPVGQRRADILRTFNAVLLPASEGLEHPNKALETKLHEFVKGAYQVKLTPRVEDPNAELSEIRLWYREDAGAARLLPRLARTLTPQGDVSFVQLVNVKVNGEVPSEVLDTRVPEGWKSDVQPLPGPPPASGGRNPGAKTADK